jgi:hypothetical protein
MRTTPISKLKVPLPKFTVVHKDDNEDDVQFLARVELEAKDIVGGYTKAEHDACLAHVRNGGRLNRVFELAGVAYGPRVMPDTDEFIEAVQKRKLDAIGKNPSKRPKAAGKKKVDAVKIAPSRGKASLKWSSAAEVASARPLKQSKKTVAHPVAAATTTHVPTGALSSKVASGASSSKGMASAKKTAMPIHKRRVPAIGAMAAASLEESKESSPHGRAAQDSTAEITSRSEAHGQSSRASLPGSVQWLEPEAPLQVTAPLDVGRTSVLNVTTG